MAKDKSGSKLDVVMKMGLVLFISLLSFAVGTFVGKKFSDNQHKVASYEHGEKATETAANDDHAEAARGVASADEHGEKSKDTLTDDEIAKLAEEFVAEENEDKEDAHGAATRKTASTGGHGSEAKADDHGAAAHGSADGHGDAKEDAHGSAKANAAKDAHAEEAPAKDAHASAGHGAPAKAEASKVMKKNEAAAAAAKAELTSAPQGKYTVQIASYPSEGEAQKTSAGLKEKGFSAFYVPAKIKDKTWYRVSVGLFTTSEEADEYRKKLDKEGISKTIVQKVTN